MRHEGTESKGETAVIEELTLEDRVNFFGGLTVDDKRQRLPARESV